MVSDSDIRELLTNINLGPKNHYICNCPFCGKPDHFYIKRQTTQQNRRGRNKSWGWDCKRCGESGGLFRLLKHFDKASLIHGTKVDLTQKLALIGDVEDNELEIKFEELPSVKYPIGFKRVYGDSYLRSRGFTEFDFQKYNVGRTNVVFKLSDYVIIGIYQQFQLKGYLARSILSKQKIDAINDGYKRRGERKKYPRYRNSDHEFSKMLGGIDEVNSATKHIVLVEGLFDKRGVDAALRLDREDHTKCLFTFGSKFSPEQLALLKQYPSIESITLIYDPDAIEKMKKLGGLFKGYDLKLGYLEDEDLGDMRPKSVRKVFKNLHSHLDFSSRKVQLSQLD